MYKLSIWKSAYMDVAKYAFRSLESFANLRMKVCQTKTTRE